MSGYQKAVSIKTLICFLQGLEGSIIKVNLRNESSITGRLQSVDGLMNLQLEGVTTLLTNGVKLCFDTMFVKGTQIRFVEIPDNINVSTTLNQQVKKSFSTSRYNERFTRKSKLKKGK